MLAIFIAIIPLLNGLFNESIVYEVQKILAAVDYFKHVSSGGVPVAVGVAGYGEGGLLALYSAAADQRIDAALVGGYFQQREKVWQEPVERNVWGLLHEFGDAEIASLILPRALVVEACRGPEIPGPAPPRDGREDAASGLLTTPAIGSVEEEFKSRAPSCRIGGPALTRLKGRSAAVLEGYALSICSGDFNEEVWKHVSIEARYSFMFTKEHEHTEFDFGEKFNYAELAGLIAPRPFMVERGHRDGVAPDEWVAYEYAKVRRRYVELGIGDRTEIEFFNGVHEIHKVGTFRFLHKHLGWPEP